MKTTLLALALFQMILTAAHPFALEPTDNGAAPGAIVIDDNAHPAVQFAAEELQKYIKLISGKHLQLRNTIDMERYKTKFFLMLPDSPSFAPMLKRFEKDIAQLKDSDGYAVRQIGKKEIWIFADCPRGVLNGVYRFLAKNTDIVWPRPAGELAIFSENPDLVFTQTDYLEKPGFRCHGMGWNYSRAQRSQELALWTARMASASCAPFTPANASFARKIGSYQSFEDTYASGGHNLIRFWLPVERFGKEHPEFYMLIDGKRFVQNNANPCVTNPQIADAFIERLREELPKMTPSDKLVNMCIADQGICCECENCLKPITLPDGRVIDKDHPAFRSTQFHIFFNKIARAFKTMSPGRHILQYGYMFLAEPPLVPVEDNVRISFCPYIRNYKETVFGPSNEKWGNRTKQWLNITQNFRWREYYGCGIMFPRPIADIAALEMKFLHDSKVKEITSEITPSDDSFSPAKTFPASDAWDLGAIEIWTLFQLMWTPGADPKALRSDYLKRTYKDAAPHMETFYRLIHDAWHNDKSISTFDDSIEKSFRYYICEKNILEPCRKALADAQKAAADPRSRALVEKAQATFEKYAEDAASREILVQNVPLIKISAFPSCNLQDELWTKAGTFTKLKKMGFPKELSPVDATVKIFSDGKNFYVGTAVNKDPRRIFIKYQEKMPFDTFPIGDHVELFLTNNRTGRYHQLAYDCTGTAWDADAHNDKWNGDWELRCQKNDSGWVTVARIPFAMLNFEPWVQSKMKFLVFISSYADEPKPFHATWGGSRVHAASDFGTLEVQWE